LAAPLCSAAGAKIEHLSVKQQKRQNIIDMPNDVQRDFGEL